MTVATPTEIRQVGLALESVRGTAPAAPTNFLSLTKDSNLDFTTKLLKDPALRGYNTMFPSFAGAQEGKGPFKTPLRAAQVVRFMNMLFGNPLTSVEQPSFVIATGVNDTLDFISTVTTYAAVIAAGTYKAGQTQADAGSLCKAIYDAIHAQEAAGTYTVSYTQATGIFTIAKSTGTFSLLLLSGSHHAISVGVTIGYAQTLATLTDLTGLDTYPATNTRFAPFKYSWAQGQIIQPPSYAFYFNRGLSSKKYNLGSLSKLKLSGKDDAPVELEADLVCQKEAAYGGSWSPTFADESPVLMFSNTTVKVAGSVPSVPNIPEWSLEMDPGLKPYRPLSQQQYPYDLLAAGPFVAKGEVTVYFMDEVERAKFLADTLTQLEFLIQGQVINAIAGSTVQDTVDLVLPNVEYESFPFGDVGSFLGAKAKFNSPGVFAAGAFVPAVSGYVICNTPPGF